MPGEWLPLPAQRRWQCAVVSYANCFSRLVEAAQRGNVPSGIVKAAASLGGGLCDDECVSVCATEVTVTVT